MNSLKKIEKYEKALEIILFCVEVNPKVNLTQLRRELKINKNFISALSKLKIIENNGNRGASNYTLLRKQTPEMTMEVLNFANKLSLNVKETIIEKHFGIIQIQKKSFLQKFVDIFKF
jgi:hypothetical protein